MKYCCRKFKRLVKLGGIIWDKDENEYYAITDFAEETILSNCPFCGKELNTP